MADSVQVFSHRALMFLYYLFLFLRLEVVCTYGGVVCFIL